MFCISVRYYTIVILLTILVNLLTSVPGFGLGIGNKNQPEQLGNHVFDESIRTVMLRSSTWELTSPVFEQGSGNRLELLFDDLSEISHNFEYTLVHCDADWYRSGLEPQEYLSGMGQGTLSESDPSVNTTCDFFHYRLEFPVEECMPILSGNYVIMVYKAGEPDRPVFTWKFYVVENLVQLAGSMKQAPAGEYRETGQQVHFTVSFGKLDIRDPLRDLAVIIQQNGRNDNSLTGLKPSFITPGKIEYTGMEEGIFQGGNEFRTLDIKSMKYQTENIAGIEFQNPFYHVYLKPDKSRETNPYFSKADLNGRYFIDREKASEKHVEADYVYVHFCLEQPYPFSEEVYVTGELADWTASDKYRMTFNAQKSCYESVLQLKQGLYDYAFAARDKSTGHLYTDIFEGNYFETSNDYEIFVYLHDSRSRCDRLIGYLPLKTSR